MNPPVNFSVPTDLTKSIDILLVEDEPGDVLLTMEALRNAKVPNYVHPVDDGVEAIAFLRHHPPYTNVPRPDLILLDLNLPRKDGNEVLAEIKSDPVLRSIPVVIFTTSRSKTDIARSYDQHANCFISKPVDLQQFISAVRSIEDFWLSVARLPNNNSDATS